MSRIDSRDQGGGLEAALLNSERVYAKEVLRILDDPRDNCKRLMDIVMATTGLILLAPLFLVISLLIMIDSPGPVFFRQRRVGRFGHYFLVWKFRTMNVMDDGVVVVQAKRNDNRVTKVGRILRRLNLDEIPQLINVLVGEMSIVGPRPHAVAHDIEFSKKCGRYAQRATVKPGITGWAQVNGFRGEIGNVDALLNRVECDLYYIAHRSIWFDVYIIALTALPRAFRNAF